ncbi:Crp/Fnr family transcriptional regulator [Aestuariibacter sp. AA17]|uniref:Crp/Fnr family transcriptional regulator n=1 Tax=Fluctibacter corallii TaxID=2984329 RepID=A0ABT3A3V2_9ALTE|nr:Crp/Fnr family transcriptional regulator [Aestuariibacter sp. AA17]MCV2883081.1 Crp/Fnr family transcriptional regulator [Aestuariibacter sp. AA17]
MQNASPNIPHILTLLKHNAWFSSIPAHLANALISAGKQRALPKGQRLHGKGEEAEGLYCLLKGRIRVSNVNRDGREMVLTWLEPGSWFGEISMFDSLPRTHNSFADETCDILVITQTRFHDLLEQHPALYPYFAQLLCARIRATFSLIDESGGLPLKGRLAKRLLMLSNGFTRQQTPQAIKPIHISQDDLAHMLNTSRQTINQLLGELEHDNVLSRGYGKITILAPETLVNFAAM